MNTQKEILELFQFQVEASDIAPIRNRHDYSLKSHNDKKNYEIPVDYDNFAEIKSAIKNN